MKFYSWHSRGMANILFSFPSYIIRDGTLPKYMVREFGPDVPKGRVYSINPALIIILVPIITAATSAVDPLIMIHYGTYVSALSVFFLAFSTSIPACVLFVITLSIGEAVWSPRLYDYTMSVAQEGREGTYMGEYCKKA